MCGKNHKSYNRNDSCWTIRPDFMERVGFDLSIERGRGFWKLGTERGTYFEGKVHVVASFPTNPGWFLPADIHGLAWSLLTLNQCCAGWTEYSARDRVGLLRPGHKEGCGLYLLSSSWEKPATMSWGCSSNPEEKPPETGGSNPDILPTASTRSPSRWVSRLERGSYTPVRFSNDCKTQQMF